MSLFICSVCNSVDNTALGRYWAEPEPKCSECYRGKWHNKFPKELYNPLRHVGAAKPINIDSFPADFAERLKDA